MTQVDRNDLGNYLREKRVSRGISLRQLANLSKEQLMTDEKALTHSHISKIETGEAVPSLRTLQKIANALELPLVIVLDRGHSDVNSVSVLSTPEFSQELLAAFHREDVVRLIQLCQQLNADQIKMLLDLAASLSLGSSQHEELPPS